MSSDLGTEAAGRAREARESRETRRARGIVHTPRELADFALRCVAERLAGAFGITSLGDPRVCLVDPAVGPGVWLEAALGQVRGSARGARFYGFDVDPEALSAARTLLRDASAARGVALSLTEANTLELASPWPEDHAGVRVIVGNPPWAARSLSRGSALSDVWLKDFMRDAAGAPLGERRVGVLSDDYVRFYRWAVEQAHTAPAGAIVCFATNSSFLDGPVHRGMRARLLESFTDLQVFDLGGNALIAREGERDENLFGVRVGAALLVLTRVNAARQGLVRYVRLRGTRADKLGTLATGALERGTSFAPAAPLLRFVPEPAGSARFDGFSLAEAFPFHREGVQTNRDALVTAHARDELWARLGAIAAGQLSVPASRHFEPERARARLAQALVESPASVVCTLAYRPFERRFVCVMPPLCHRPRPDLRAAMAQSSWALVSARKDRGGQPFHLFGAVGDLPDACFLSVRSSCRTRAFPTNTPEGDDNLSPAVRERLVARLGADTSAGDVMAYALAVLASALFRARAGDALKQDYPRVPWPRDRKGFRALAELGHALRGALCEPAGDLVGVRVLGAPDLRVDTARAALDPASGRIAFADGALEHVPERAFRARVGHYLVVQNLRKTGRICTLSHLADVVARATRWVDLSERADALLGDASNV